MCVKIWRVFHIRDRKYRFKINTMCLINDYWLIADLNIFVYGSAECATISLECTKVKLLILNDLEIFSHLLQFYALFPNQYI